MFHQKQSILGVPLFLETTFYLFIYTYMYTYIYIYDICTGSHVYVYISIYIYPLLSVTGLYNTTCSKYPHQIRGQGHAAVRALRAHRGVLRRQGQRAAWRAWRI